MRPVEDVTPYPPRPVGWPLSTQGWARVTFLHWAVPPERVASRLPAGVRADTVGGLTYVGLIALLMQEVAVTRRPAVPYLGSFLETNVRLYSVDGAGRRGVVFLSMDASRLGAVLAARWGTGLPYCWSQMRQGRRGDRMAYRCRRRWPGPGGAASHLVVRVGEPVDPGPVEDFLTARWGLHLAGPRGRTLYWPTAHPPWRLRAASVLRFEDALLAAAGFAGLAGTAPVSVLHADGVRAELGVPRPI